MKSLVGTVVAAALLFATALTARAAADRRQLEVCIRGSPATAFKNSCETSIRVCYKLGEENAAAIKCADIAPGQVHRTGYTDEQASKSLTIAVCDTGQKPYELASAKPWGGGEYYECRE
jgi:hypothetical protein